MKINGLALLTLRMVLFYRLVEIPLRVATKKGIPRTVRQTIIGLRLLCDIRSFSRNYLRLDRKWKNLPSKICRTKAFKQQEVVAHSHKVHDRKTFYKLAQDFHSSHPYHPAIVADVDIRLLLPHNTFLLRFCFHSYLRVASPLIAVVPRSLAGWSVRTRPGRRMLPSGACASAGRGTAARSRATCWCAGVTATTCTG